MPRIYLDHNATTRPDPRVRDAMAAALADCWGNPSSVHGAGRAARELVERSRRQVAALCSARPEEIVFTSGGTEGDHLAIRGAALAMRARSGRRVLVSSPLEHPAVLGCLAALGDEGFELRMVPVDGEGRVEPAELRRQLDETVALCTFAAANHELGTLYPIAALCEAAHRVGALFHTDAVQAAGKTPLDLSSMAIDLATLSAHKLHGPKGVGAVFQRRGLALSPLWRGGHQEKERRPGTENVPGIVGFGVACELAAAELPARAAHAERLRDRLEGGALGIAGARRFGAAAPRVPGTTSLGFAGVDGELLTVALDLEDVAISTGSACSSGSIEPSPVIRALGVPAAVARQAVRFSLGHENTEAEIDRVLALLPWLVERIRRAEQEPIE